jgi:hypothetical protein
MNDDVAVTPLASDHLSGETTSLGLLVSPQQLGTGQSARFDGKGFIASASQPTSLHAVTAVAQYESNPDSTYLILCGSPSTR